ncbi:MAG TPA: hypothetical protein VNB64_00910 [Solirubrobacteraceae bacterium]|nr:hypothetical protein [Solirubrobacteraceae bacterium]
MNAAIRRRWPLLAAASGLLALVAWEQLEFHAGASRAAADALRAGAATVVLFGACGYGAALLLTPRELWPHRHLLALPLGAALSAVALGALGIAHVPFGVSLPLVLVAGAVTAVLAHRREHGRRPDAGGPAPPRADPSGEPPPAEAPASRDGFGARVGWPLLLAAVVAVVALSPVWRTGFGTVVGQNGDVVLAVGSAELVKHAPPTAVRAELPVDRVPLVWRSKYPIFYPLAAVSELSGLSPIATFPFLAAAMLGLVAIGFFLLARVALRAPPAAALGAMAAVGLARLPVHVADHPFYNQLWALFALPLILVAGAAFVRDPGRRSLALLVLFAAIGAFAYPLMLPFPALFLALAAWRERRRLRLSRPSLPVAAGAVAGLALTAVLLRGVVEKAVSAAIALSPWGDLGAWSGNALLNIPFHRSVGLLDPGGTVLVMGALAAVLAAAAYAVWRAPRDVGAPLGVTVAAGLLAAAYFRHRTQAELFYFKTVGFAGALAGPLAVVGLADLVRRRRPPALAAGAGVALAAFAVAIALNTRRELLDTNVYVSRDVLAIRDWSRSLPPGATVRIDVPPGGHQLWAAYMLADRRVCALRPLIGFFPYPPQSRRAGYAVAYSGSGRPRDATGPAVRRTRQFTMWRLRPGLPGPDVCSRRMIDSITSVQIV